MVTFWNIYMRAVCRKKCARMETPFVRIWWCSNTWNIILFSAISSLGFSCNITLKVKGALWINIWITSVSEPNRMLSTPICSTACSIATSWPNYTICDKIVYYIKLFLTSLLVFSLFVLTFLAVLYLKHLSIGISSHAINGKPIILLLRKLRNYGG